MDIELRTNDDARHLELRDITKSGRDYVCTLAVESNGFGARRTFRFDEDGLREFASKLAVMNEALEGRAMLKHPYEDDYVSLEMSGAGRVIVTGLAIEHGEHGQQLEFGFGSDQTVLRPLINDLAKLCDSTGDET